MQFEVFCFSRGFYIFCRGFRRVCLYIHGWAFFFKISKVLMGHRDPLRKKTQHTRVRNAAGWGASSIPGVCPFSVTHNTPGTDHVFASLPQKMQWDGDGKTQEMPKSLK